MTKTETKSKIKTEDKYVTESMLEKAFVRFGETFGPKFRNDIRKDIREDTQKIVDLAVDNLAVLSRKHFDRLENKFNILENKVDTGFAEVNKRLDDHSHIFESLHRAVSSRVEKRAVSGV